MQYIDHRPVELSNKRTYTSPGRTLSAMETGADYPSSANNREDPYRNPDPSAGGLVSGGSSTLNKRSRRRRYSFFEHPWINPVDLKNLAHTSDCPITAGSSMLTR